MVVVGRGRRRGSSDEGKEKPPQKIFLGNGERVVFFSTDASVPFDEEEKSTPSPSAQYLLMKIKFVFIHNFCVMTFFTPILSGRILNV